MSDNFENQNYLAMSDKVGQNKKIAIRISQDDYEKLEEVARREECTVSRIIRLAIKKYLRDYYAQDLE